MDIREVVKKDKMWLLSRDAIKKIQVKSNVDS